MPLVWNELRSVRYVRPTFQLGMWPGLLQLIMAARGRTLPAVAVLWCVIAGRVNVGCLEASGNPMGSGGMFPSRDPFLLAASRA